MSLVLEALELRRADGVPLLGPLQLKLGPGERLGLVGESGAGKSLLARACERLVVLYAGQILEAGPTDLLLAGPRHPYTARLLEAAQGRPSSEAGSSPPPKPDPWAAPSSPAAPAGMPPVSIRNPGEATPGQAFVASGPWALHTERTMHPLLRTLDLDPGEPSSPVHALQPIRDAAAAPSRSLPLVASLGLTPLVIYGLSLGLRSPAAQTLQGALLRARNSVTLLLSELPPEGQHPPARALVGPEGPGGTGHREGTNDLDPRLAVHTALLSRPSEAIDPESLSLSPSAERVNLSLNPALPPAVGGNGLTRGSGRDAALGSGGLTRPPQPVPVPDFKLVPTRQASVYHQLQPGEAFSHRDPMRVRILIGEDGVPTQAILVSGPEFLREKALKAAREWRFEPLGPHGLKAPQALVLVFYPNFLRAR